MQLRASASMLWILTAVACGGDDTAAEQTSQACKVAADCYPKIDAAMLLGDPICLDRVPEGYCTHLCEEDSDCCAVNGECSTGHPQVCAPFESTGQKQCFLSCETQLVSDAKSTDANAYCAAYANAAFGCRSTGGGSQNRKICMP